LHARGQALLDEARRQRPGVVFVRGRRGHLHAVVHARDPRTPPPSPDASVDLGCDRDEGLSAVRFLDDRVPTTDLTFADVFLVPCRSDGEWRLDADLATNDGSGTPSPFGVANMTAVAGRRTAETIARRGGIAIISQDIPVDIVADVIAGVKSRHTVFETPITL